VSFRARGLIAAAAVLSGWAVPSAALAHAYLVRTAPASSVVLNAPPASVQLTYDEAVEPRFAVISVTAPAGTQETTGAVSRSPGNPDTLVVPLRPHLPSGWYEVYWRAISVDGHPVQGAYTFAVGPDPGVAPKFAIPSIAGSATSADVLITRWAMFLTVMTAIGLFVFRFLIARPMVVRDRGTGLRHVSRALVITSVLGLISIPVYLDASTAIDSLHSVFDVWTLVPLFRVTAFGRAYVDMLVCFALFCLAAGVALWVDRPDRTERSVVEVISVTGALLAAAAVLLIPGIAGHAAQTSPRGISVALDWLHLVTGSVWIGGLVGLLVLWFSLMGVTRVAGLSTVVPRFSRIALVSVALLLGTGTWATINHMPALNALWLTGYGVTILVKIGLLLVAMALASVNLWRSKPLLVAARVAPEVPTPATKLLRRLVGGEAVLVAAAIFAAALLSSLAPPPPAFALQNGALATVGPGRVLRTVLRNGYRLQVLVTPNRAVAPDAFGLRITHNGELVRGATVTLTFNQIGMAMPQQEYQLTEIHPGIYARTAPALVMVGTWALEYQITPKGEQPFTALIVDQANG
jgi:copper transport protein